ncbi:hypothetical protein DH2020_043314 [Rehmannia glutinosa]|uniref:Uncharacterized protein n=1 Tax=Rehmannia glutinosa TaxID=99300 RepID=A0ABR0UL67_REHGL
MCIRETENQVYERDLMVFAFKQAEWKRERKRLKDEVKKLSKILEEKQERIKEFDNNNINDQWELNNSNHFWVLEQEKRRDETVEKWKQLYFAIKGPVRFEKRLCWKTEEQEMLVELKRELKAKEEIIEILQSKLAKMEQQESKREREMDILRQSLRIMSHKRRAPKLGQRSIQ